MLLTWLALGAIGFTAGGLGALLGLGGGIFLVPALTLIFDLPIRAAVGTSLIGVIATSAGVASVSKPGRGANVRLAMRLELLTTLGALGGSFLAGLIAPRIQSFTFAAIVVATALYSIRKMRGRAEAASENAIGELFRADYKIRRWPVGLTASSVAGLLSGLTGAGGGFIKVPIMHSVMDVPLGVATATSNFMVGITAAASAMVYYGRGDIYPWVAVPTAIGVFAGAVLGSRLAGRVRASSLRVALVVLLFLIALQMVWKGLTG